MSGQVATKKFNGLTFQNSGILGGDSNTRKKAIWKQFFSNSKGGGRLLTIRELKKKAISLRKKGLKVRIAKETQKVWGTYYRIWIRG